MFLENGLELQTLKQGWGQILTFLMNQDYSKFLQCVSEFWEDMIGTVFERSISVCNGSMQGIDPLSVNFNPG